MQRFHLTVFLGASAALASLLTPDLEAPEAVVVDTGPEPASIQRSTLGVRAGLDRSIVDGTSERYIVVELAGLAPIEASQPVELVLAIDVSGSMAGARLRDARAAVARLVDELEPEDRVSVVAFSGKAYEVLHRGRPDQVLAAVDQLRAHGNTNIQAALEAAGGSRDRTPSWSRPQRVLLLSDGQANVGHKWSEDLIEDARALGDIEVSAIGLGTGIDQGSLMGIADATGGDYLYLSSPADVADAFTDQLDRLRAQSARAAEVELVLAPGVELLDVYGYEEVDGRATTTGWTAEIGSVSEGDARKMVARVLVPAEVALQGEVARVEVAWNARKHHRVTLPVRVAVGEAPEASVQWWATDHVLDARTGRALDDVLEAPTASQAQAVTAERVVLEELAYAYGRAPTTAPLERLESGWLVAAAGSEERMDLEALTALEALGYVE